MQDLWRAVWQNNSRLIVMLCDLEEPGPNSQMKAKCCRYWPAAVNEELFFGVFGIKLVRRFFHADIVRIHP